MNLVIIGAQASGKMTIGQEIEKMTDMTLFHNHDSIDFVSCFMEYGPISAELIRKIRLNFFEAFAPSNPPLISTVVFHSFKREVLFVELETDLTERLRRNRTEHRLQCKPVKRDLEWSEKDILSTMTFAQFNPEKSPEFLKYYYKINNTELSARESAQLILQKLNDIEKK